MWHTRTLPKVKPAFEKIWKTDDLLVSFDGCGVFRPPEYNPEWRTNGGWYHIDQNVYNKKGRHAVQVCEKEEEVHEVFKKKCRG